MNIQDSLPNSYEDLDQTLDVSNYILSDAVENTKTLFHTLTVSSYDGNSISSRVMVLREFDLSKRIMRFHTDYRASKIKKWRSGECRSSRKWFFSIKRNTKS